MNDEVKIKAEQIFYAVSANDKAYHTWLNTKNKIKKCYKDMENYLNYEAKDSISMFRRMTPDDMSCGQIVFGIGDCGWYCHIIEEVICPSDQWKAYCASDGCRYGLYKSYILIENIGDITK